MSLRQRLKRLLQPVSIADLERLEPVSREFGFDRGLPIDRYYIERFIEQHQSAIRGDVLEVAESLYTDRFGCDVKSRNRLVLSASDGVGEVVGDLTHADSLPRDRFDCFICTQTLNFIFDLKAAVEGIETVLKPGGTLLLTAAGPSQVSRYDMDRWGDYWRMTTAAMTTLFETFSGDVQVSASGNLVATMALLQGLAVEDLPDASILDSVDDDYEVIVTVRAIRH